MKLSWVEAETMEGKSLTIPVHVNVVPGDQAAGRVPDPKVVTELNFQQVQRAKREASDALARGDHESARRIWHDTRQQVFSIDRGGMSRQERLDFDEELQTLDRITERADHDINVARKMSMSDYHRKNRRRGRGPSE